ncbi:MAG: hypothetical protein COB81_05990 [Flavobacteriaceae bacterium]|nr:MAG: hypothetical protein COB81_05990 [Flavobacteriaceae bacterium]
MKYTLRLFALLLILLIYTPSTGQDIVTSEHHLIQKKAEWKYHDGSELSGTNWQVDKKLHQNWKTGFAPFGYATDSITTTISYGSNPKDKYLVAYFTTTREIENPFKYKAYLLNIRRDDGAIVYINGTEVLKSNISYDTNSYNDISIIKTVTKSSETRYYSSLLLPTDFTEGENIISVAIYQRSPRSTDLAFDLELTGTNSNYLIERTASRSNQTTNNSTYNLLSTRIELEKKELALKLLEFKNETITTVTLILIVVLLILLGTCIYFISLNTKNRKTHHQITTGLYETITYKDKEAITNSLKSIEHKQFLEYLKKDLEKINSVNKSENYLDIHKVIKQIDYNLDQLHEWEDLKNHFNSVHSGFFERIHIEFPSLTQNELKHCSLIKLHLSTKEISKILYINPRSVQASRYRIKKKLNLNEDTDLKEYLKSY